MTQLSQTMQPAQKRFTGKHMALIFIAFFGVVIAVNVLMARLAISSFGGVVVENSYVASQQFNGWLGQARAEKALGWKAGIGRGAADEVRIVLRDKTGAAINGARVTAVAEHPLGARVDERLAFSQGPDGSYTARLTAGRWRIKLFVVSEGHVWRSVGDVQ